ncbi:BON domain-containing protein [Magnetospirillum molischianum]|uniref:Periplasmic or secreted lipoprotein n=1 Tax=Magnetospirillum molischianum DSM 120 TaxID=1150626 RepID=H8FVM1_MAGML|nr:BON domain-containing protein [Magnetospirillum molischianum]CCG42409.1 Periplasmic or secreted lipoprotein [Magnetospirillum molischianum DSM 120]
MINHNKYFRNAISIAAVTVMVSGCTVFSGRETTGEYVDDATVTTRVNAQIINDSSLRASQISVETMQDVVQLSGFVDSAKAKERAGEIARNTEGVRSVRNNIIVR